MSSSPARASSPTVNLPPPSGQLWQAAADAMPGGLVVLDPDGVILAVNAGWRCLPHRLSRRTIDVGVNYLDVCDRAAETRPEPAEVAAAIRRVLDGTSTSAASEYRLGERWYRMTARACRSQGAAAVIAHEDVTECRRSEQRTVAARSYLDAVTESMGEGLVVLDVEGRVRTMNPAAEAILGWPFDALEGQVMHELAHFVGPDGTDYPREDCPITNAYQSGDTMRVAENTFLRRDGSPLPAAYTASPLHSPDGHEGCVVVFMDASHLRAEERRLRQQLAELSWIRRIEDAWEHDRFRLYSQPIVRLPGGEPVQQELLLRIEEADGTIALPGPYLRAAERHGLVGRIDRWVIRGAVDHAATGLDVEVNVSAATLSDLSLFSDREFVHDLATNDRSRHVVRAVVHLARGFGLQTVAEGVEDGETLRLLGDLGVDLAQGFYLGSPTPVSAS